MATTDQYDSPLAVTVQSASPHESRLVEPTLAASLLDELPERRIGDRAYDSDPLGRYLAQEYDIEMIAPHRSNRTCLITQDGRPLRRYRHRRKIEPLFA